MISIAVCEDKAEERELLCGMLGSFVAENALDMKLFSFTNAEELLKSPEAEGIGILFMDIYLDGMDGVKAVELLKEKNPDFVAVFTTVSRDHALDGFRVGAVHYLLKPFSQKELGEALQRCCKILGMNLRTIELCYNKVSYQLRLRDILYAEVRKNQCYIHTVNKGIFKAYTSLQELAERIDEPSFVHCHRSYLVNLKYVARIQDVDLVMDNGDRVLVRRSDRLKVRQKLTNYMLEEV